MIRPMTSPFSTPLSSCAAVAVARATTPEQTRRARLMRVVTLAAIGTVPLLAWSARAAHSDTLISSPAAGSSAVAIPGGPRGAGTLVAVVSAQHTSGNAAMARRALLAANAALRQTPGFQAAPMPGDHVPVSTPQVAQAMRSVNFHFPFTARDYQDIGKALKVTRALSITVSPDTVTPDGASYTAVAELYDTKSGGLIGMGRTSSTVSPADVAATDAATTDAAPAPTTATTPEVTPEQRALDASVAGAVFELSRTAQFNAIVISKPSAYAARLSLGELSGVRGGARVEYLSGGLPVAFGTVVDVGQGEAVATVAPETAFPGIYANMPVRIVNNPSSTRSLPSQLRIDEKEFSSFERQFTLSLGIIGAIYYVAAR